MFQHVNPLHAARTNDFTAYISQEPHPPTVSGQWQVRFKATMYWDVTTVKPLPNHRIYVEIEDGRKGIFDLTPYLDHGVFRELRDVHYFNCVGIE